MDLEKEFLAFCAKAPQGVSDVAFRQAYPNSIPSDLVWAINNLVSKGAIQIFKSPEGLIYKAILNSEAEHIGDLDPNEKVVYQCIKLSDNKGIWIRDLKIRTNLHQTVLTKTLRSLESKRIIKSVRSVKNSTRKVYMLSHLEPSTEITGGPWFSDNELDIEFIEEICKTCYKYVAANSLFENPVSSCFSRSHKLPTLAAVHEFVIQSGITKTDLSPEDISIILDRLVFDGKLVKLGSSLADDVYDPDESPHEPFVYKAIKASLPPTFIGAVPCNSCTNYNRCEEEGLVSPLSCKYFSEWL